jgi:hypothetical protein
VPFGGKPDSMFVDIKLQSCISNCMESFLCFKDWMGLNCQTGQLPQEPIMGDVSFLRARGRPIKK